MSYDVSLMSYSGDILESEMAIQEGGTQVVGGTNLCELNITANYSEVYSIFDWSIRDLHGKRASETIETLEMMIIKLGTDKFDNYWAPTPGNAGYALSILLRWAKEHPQGIWEVSY